MTAAAPDFRTDPHAPVLDLPAQCSIAHGPSTQTFPMKTAGAASRVMNLINKKIHFFRLSQRVRVRRGRVELSRSIQSFMGQNPAVLLLYNCPHGTDARATGPGNASALSKALHCMLLVTLRGPWLEIDWRLECIMTPDCALFTPFHDFYLASSLVRLTSNRSIPSH